MMTTSAETRTLRNGKKNGGDGVIKTAFQNVSTPTSSITTKANDDKTIQSMSSSIREILQEVKALARKLTEVESAIEFLSGKYDEMKRLLENTNKENTAIKLSQTKIDAMNIEIQNENLQMREKINSLQQNAINNNVVIFGIPNLKDYNSVKTTFNNLIQNLEIRQQDIEIEDMYQIKTRTEQAPVFVKFSNYRNKTDFLQAAKHSMSNKGHITADQIGFTNNQKRVAIVDQLTERNRNLLREAKSLRSQGFKYIWTKNGKICVRKTSESNIIIIKTMAEIDELKQLSVTI